MTGQRDSDSNAGARVRLATYNVQNLGREDNPGPVYDAKLAFLTDVLRRLGADLVVIDEVREADCFEELVRTVGLYPEWFLGNAPEDFRRIQTGIMTRLRVLERGNWLDFPAVLPGQTQDVIRIKFRRPIPWVTVALPNDESAFVAAVHLKSGRPEVESIPESETELRREVLGRGMAIVGRALESSGLRCRLDDVIEEGKAEHYVVMGDFNDGPDSDQVRAVSGIDDDLSDSPQGIGRRLLSVAGLIPPSRRVSYIGRKRQELLDQILVSEKLSLGLRAAGVETQLIEGNLRRNHDKERSGYPRSDHAPLWAEFELQPAW